MIEAVFVDSVPAKITIHDFRRHCLQSFPQLASGKYDGLLADAIDAVYAMFSGVAKLWDLQPAQVWYDKTVLCYRLLVSWYIADSYPGFVSGVTVMGGVPLKRKKIDGTDITFANNAAGSNIDLLTSLNSNPWGVKACLMIKTSAKRALLRNCRVV
jgi:hypothetical protein